MHAGRRRGQTETTMNRSNGKHQEVHGAPLPDGQFAEVGFISILNRLHPLTRLEMARLMLVAHIVDTGQRRCVLEDPDYVVTVMRKG